MKANISRAVVGGWGFVVRAVGVVAAGECELGAAVQCRLVMIASIYAIVED